MLQDLTLFGQRLTVFLYSREVLLQAKPRHHAAVALYGVVHKIKRRAGSYGLRCDLTGAFAYLRQYSHGPSESRAAGAVK